jgi:nucleotide-binding universal stress UspA family protein
MDQEYSKIMVAVDGSNEAELAFRKAVNVAKRNQAELLLAHVIDTRAFQTVSSFDNVLAEQATDNNDIDLIMLGATGLNAVERLFIGSVSEYVIRNAACDVLIVRTDLDNKIPEEDK